MLESTSRFRIRQAEVQFSVILGRFKGVFFPAKRSVFVYGDVKYIRKAMPEMVPDVLEHFLYIL